MKVVGYASSNDRRDIRRPLEDYIATVGDMKCGLVDISLGGFQVSGARGRFKSGDEVVLRALGDVDGNEVVMNAKAEIMRVFPNKGSLGCKFINLSPSNFNVVERLVMGRGLAVKKPAKRTAKKGLKKKKPGGVLGLFGR